jgi:hypothetical protein
VARPVAGTLLHGPDGRDHVPVDVGLRGHVRRPQLRALREMSKVVFSSTLKNPLAWANTRLVDQDPVEAVRSMKEADTRPLRTLGSVTLCRSLHEEGLVGRFRVVVFPVITGSTGRERIYDGYPDVASKWSPAGRSTAGCSLSSTCPLSSPVRRAAVSSPELRQGVRSVRNKVSGLSRSRPGALPREQYEISTDGRLFETARSAAVSAVPVPMMFRRGRRPWTVSDVTGCRAASSW